MITGSLLLFIIASSSKPLNRTHTKKKKKKETPNPGQNEKVNHHEVPINSQNAK